MKTLVLTLALLALTACTTEGVPLEWWTKTGVYAPNNCERGSDVRQWCPDHGSPAGGNADRDAPDPPDRDDKCKR